MSTSEGGGELFADFAEASLAERRQLVALTAATIMDGVRLEYMSMENGDQVLYLDDVHACFVNEKSVCLYEVEKVPDVRTLAECLQSDDMYFPDAPEWRAAGRMLIRAVLQPRIFPIRRLSYRFIDATEPYLVNNRGASYYGSPPGPADPVIGLADVDVADGEPGADVALRLSSLEVNDWTVRILGFREAYGFPKMSD